MKADSEKPLLQDFDVTPEQWDLYSGKGPDVGLSVVTGWLVGFLGYVAFVSAIAWISFGRNWDDPLGATISLAVLGLIPAMAVGGAVAGVSSLFQLTLVNLKKSRLLKSPVVSRIKQYEEAQATYNEAQSEASKAQQEADRQQQEAESQHRESERAKQAALRAEQRKRQQFWERLGGIEFERELGNLYRAIGYHVQSTPVSGDQGVDLILRKNGQTTVVQCKAQKRPASPAVIRDLYGSMHHFKADNAILACTGGFSDNVIEFARDKPIKLISARDIARMAEESGGEIQDMAESSPICPNLGCGRTMVLRQGSRGRFWGCPRFPTCRGTRDI